jgi:hypothetical protein
VELEATGERKGARMLQTWADTLPSSTHDVTVVSEWWPDLELRWNDLEDVADQPDKYASVGWALKRLSGFPVHILRDE